MNFTGPEVRKTGIGEVGEHAIAPPRFIDLHRLAVILADVAERGAR